VSADGDKVIDDGRLQTASSRAPHVNVSRWLGYTSENNS
jgi:hypothetical protein